MSVMGQETEGVPQRLKPASSASGCGTHSTALRAGSEAVPLSKTNAEILECEHSRMTLETEVVTA